MNVFFEEILQKVISYKIVVTCSILWTKQPTHY